MIKIHIAKGLHISDVSHRVALRRPLGNTFTTEGIHLFLAKIAITIQINLVECRPVTPHPAHHRFLTGACLHLFLIALHRLSSIQLL